MIYFVLRPDGAIKIGTTTNLPNRLVSLRERWRCSLQVLGVLPGSYEKEAELHARFQDARFQFEWHRPTPELLRFIVSNAEKWEGWEDYSPPEQSASDQQAQWMRDQQARVITERKTKLEWLMGSHGARLFQNLAEQLSEEPKSVQAELARTNPWARTENERWDLVVTTHKPPFRDYPFDGPKDDDDQGDEP